MTRHQLMRDLTERYSGKDANLEVLDFLSRNGSVLDALMYSYLFWPTFVEILDMVFVVGRRRGRNPPEMAGLQNALKDMRDSWRVEESFNLFELPSDLFDYFANTSDEQVELLAERIVEAWRAKLAVDFPSRRFEVKVLSPSETGGEVGITFHQVSN